MQLTESDGEIEYGPDEVAEPERPVLPNVLGHDRAHHGRVELKADVDQRLSQSLGLQYSSFLLGVSLERVLPEFDGADEVLELLEVDFSKAFRVESGNDESAHLQASATLNVVWN